MKQLQRWGSFCLAIFLLQSSGAAQQQNRKATVHIVVVDGFGHNLGEATVTSFKDFGSGKNLAQRFHDNTAKDVPYGVYQVRAHKVAFFSGEVTAQVFQPDVWVMVGLSVGEELPAFPAPRLQISGTIENLDPAEEPIYLRLEAVYSDFVMDTRIEPLGRSGTFTLAGVIRDGKYVLITIGRTKILDIRPIDVQFPMKAPITIDLQSGRTP
jgi:hypothetical protein